MAELKTGKKIHQLDRLDKLIKDDSWFPISQDGITVRTNLGALKEFINGDDSDPNDRLYYSSDKIASLFNDAKSRMDTIEHNLSVTNHNLEELSGTVTNYYSTLDARITELDGKLNTEINDRIAAINKEVNDRNEAIAAAVAAEAEIRKNTDDDILNRISNINTAITNINSTITRLEDKFGEVNKFYIGYNFPQSNSIYKDNDIYFQYF